MFPLRAKSGASCMLMSQVAGTIVLFVAQLPLRCARKGALLQAQRSQVSLWSGFSLHVSSTEASIQEAPYLYCLTSSEKHVWELHIKGIGEFTQIICGMQSLFLPCLVWIPAVRTSCKTAGGIVAGRVPGLTNWATPTEGWVDLSVCCGMRLLLLQLVASPSSSTRDARGQLYWNCSTLEQASNGGDASQYFLSP